MELRNITRHYTFTKALKKRNKGASFNLLHRQFTTLYAVYLCSKVSPVIHSTNIHLKCRLLNSATNIDFMYSDLIYLADHGLINIIRLGKWKFSRYQLTNNGLQCLQEFEHIHRNERLDK